MSEQVRMLPSLRGQALRRRERLEVGGKMYDVLSRLAEISESDQIVHRPAWLEDEEPVRGHHQSQ